MGIMELKIPVLTGLYQMYSRISDISAEKWKSGVLKTWRKWKKFVVESSHRCHHRLFSHVVSHFPQHFSFCFVHLLLILLLFLLLLHQFWLRLHLSSCSFCFICVYGSCFGEIIKSFDGLCYLFIIPLKYSFI